MTPQSSDTYFARFGAENHNIWVVDDREYVMSRFNETSDDTYYMLFEHSADRDGVRYWMFENPPETMLDATPDGEYSTEEFAARIGGQDRFLHNINIRRLLHRSGRDGK